MEEKKPVKVLDVEKQERMKRAKAKQLSNMQKRAKFVKYTSIVLIFALICRIGYIKVVHGEEYEKQAVIQPTTQSNEKQLIAKRGDILDRTGKPLATSTSVYNVFVDIIVINQLNEESKEKNVIDTVAQGLNETINYPIADFKALFAKDANGELVNNVNYYVIAKELPSESAIKLEDKNLPGVHLEELGNRTYPYNDLAAQTIGFIGGDGQSSNWGLENYYNDELTGVNGRNFVSYDDNQSVRNFEVESIKGNTVVTTIDATLQQFCDELVDKYAIMHGAKNAGIIIMKAKTGEILTMSEYPRFDNNYPGKLSSVTDPNFEAEDEQLDDSEKGEHIYSLWKNFNVSNTFEPGSIFKPVTVAMALEEGIISNDDVFYCDGYKTYPDGTRVKCWIYDSTGGGHGKLNVEEALANSCNVAMMEIAEKLDSELFEKYQKEFGYGSNTGIDLPGEEDAKNLVYNAEKLNEVELGTGAFGQGFNATAIQDLVAFNATINGGKIIKPYVVSDILDSNGNVVQHTEPTILRTVISEETSDIIRNDLIGTVEYGTGKNLAIDGYTIGGKTGTAEQVPRGSGKYALSFVGFLPANDPEYIAIGVLNEPNDYLTEHTSAVPMMKEVFQKLINYYNIPTDSMVLEEASGNTVFMQDYTGSVISAVESINSKGYNYEISGSGDHVYKQSPAKGQPIDENTTIILYVNSSDESVKSQLVEVPDVVGVELNEAERILTDLGFSVLKTTEEVFDTENAVVQAPESTIEDDFEETRRYTVTKQMPKKGISLPKGTQIRLMYK